MPVNVAWRNRSQNAGRETRYQLTPISTRPWLLNGLSRAAYIDTFQSDPVVVFCAYGFPVGCKTAIALRDAGFDATYKGGHSAWKAIGGPIQSHTPQPIAILAEQVEP